MFDQPILICGSSNGGESYENNRDPELFDRKSGVTTGNPALRLDAVLLESVYFQQVKDASYFTMLIVKFHTRTYSFKIY